MSAARRDRGCALGSCKVKPTHEIECGHLTWHSAGHGLSPRLLTPANVAFAQSPGALTGAPRREPQCGVKVGSGTACAARLGVETGMLRSVGGRCPSRLTPSAAGSRFAQKQLPVFSSFMSQLSQKCSRQRFYVR